MPEPIGGPAGVRLQKALAAAGIASRRACDSLVAAGRVEVNGVKAVPGTRIDPDVDVVRVDGSRVTLSRSLTYLAYNKPVGVVSTMRDPEGRPSLGDMIPVELGVNHVGRLDVETEGLLLLTNDGDLAHRLTHPSWEVSKRYFVDVVGKVSPAELRLLRKGVQLDDGLAAFDAVQTVQQVPGRTLLEVSLHEGRNRIVRRMMESVGHPVERLVRVSVGPITLGELRSGRWRHLQRQEVESLHRLVDL